MAGLRARIVQALPELLALGPCWERLHGASEGTTPWQGFDFVANWWPCMAGKRRLRTVVVERGDEPCLILPLQLSRWPWQPGLPVYILEPIGSIMDVNQPRLGLGPPDADAWECALEALWAMRDQWHTIRLGEQSGDEGETALLRDFAQRHRLLFRNSFSHVCPYLDLRQDWPAYLASRSSKFRKNLRAAERRLEARGPVSLQVCRTPDEIAAGFEVVLRLHRASWKSRDRIEHSQSEAYRRFHASWLRDMARSSQARILVLRCGGVPVAAALAFTDEHTYYAAQIVHDESYAPCSPGTLLEARELEALMREGCFSRYDMMGSFLNNKLRWTDSVLQTSTVHVTRPGLRTALFDGYYSRLKPGLRPRLLPVVNRFRKDHGVR